ncbi:PopZ family protein [Microvirga puerhi]|uniref:DUF2497 domain-containing protein n=1 Tax=Microvirga puerhi TaxID=2876078 RepID=A0ABS7VMQ7_9HYPH|nr:DUF2497 domain-containing protein [Microvirga puerhi]MBZ6076828.1 DUF2497 domain-containing protein [Microvirga puerhi]
MSAVNPKAQEPSMEEILASIRRIIADDQEGLRAVEASRAYPEPVPFRTARDSGERSSHPQVIPLTVPDPQEPEDMLGLLVHGEAAEDTLPLDIPSAEPFEMEEARSEVSDLLDVYVESSERETRGAGMSQGATAPADGEDTLLSGVADAAVAASFGRLGATLTAKTPQTMEGFVAEMLRPLLKDWLDENLPALVERLVQAEIERIVRARR